MLRVGRHGDEDGNDGAAEVLRARERHPAEEPATWCAHDMWRGDMEVPGCDAWGRDGVAMSDGRDSLDYGALARALLAEGLAGALAAELRPAVSPPAKLLTRDELAHALSVSPQTVDRRVRKGMPVEYVGDLPRFELAKCRTWLASQGSDHRPLDVAVGEEHLLRSITPRSRKAG